MPYYFKAQNLEGAFQITNLTEGETTGLREGLVLPKSLLEFLEKANKHGDAGKPVNIVYLDFQKVFKTLLLAKEEEERWQLANWHECNQGPQ